MPHTYQWIGRYTEKLVYLQYATPDFEHVAITFERLIANRSMWLVLHDATSAMTPETEVPGFARLCLEAGTDDDALSVNGIGRFEWIIGGDRKGGVAFRDTHMAETEGNLDMLRQVLSACAGELRCWVNDYCYRLPVGPKDLAALLVVASHQDKLAHDVKQSRLFTAI